MELKKYVGVLVKNGDKCLLCKRNAEGSFPGMWSLPAGKIEKNEFHFCLLLSIINIK